MSYLTQAVKKQIRSHFFIGMKTDKEIANKFNVSVSSVYNWRKHYAKEFKENLMSMLVNGQFNINALPEFVEVFSHLISKDDLCEIIHEFNLKIGILRETRDIILKTIKSN